MPTREAVMTALLARAATATSFATISRQVVMIPGAPTPQIAIPPAQPALYLLESHEETKREGRGRPAVRSWFVELWLWCKIPIGETLGVPGATPGATAINTLIEAIEAALVPDNAELNEFTLDGLVQFCRIEGHTVKVPGDINPDGQCFAAIPLRILVP
jgi:hypothetical protein